MLGVRFSVLHYSHACMHSPSPQNPVVALVDGGASLLCGKRDCIPRRTGEVQKVCIYISSFAAQAVVFDAHVRNVSLSHGFTLSGVSMPFSMLITSSIRLSY